MRAAKKHVLKAGVRDAWVREAYLHLLSAEHNARSLAAKLGVSRTTAARVIEALRGRIARKGRRLLSVRDARGCHYLIQDVPAVADPEKDPLLAYVIPAARLHPSRGKEEDKDYDTD